MDTFNAQTLGKTVWAYAKTGTSQSNASQFAILARAAVCNVGELNAEGFANTAWALAVMGWSDWDNYGGDI